MSSKPPFSNSLTDAFDPSNIELTSATYRIGRLESALGLVITRLAKLEDASEAVEGARRSGR